MKTNRNLLTIFVFWGKEVGDFFKVKQVYTHDKGHLFAKPLELLTLQTHTEIFTEKHRETLGCVPCRSWRPEGCIFPEDLPRVCVCATLGVLSPRSLEKYWTVKSWLEVRVECWWIDDSGILTNYIGSIASPVWIKREASGGLLFGRHSLVSVLCLAYICLLLAYMAF